MMALDPGVTGSEIPKEDNARNIPPNSITTDENNAGDVAEIDNAINFPTNSIAEEDNAGNVKNENDCACGVLLEYAHKGDWVSTERLFWKNPGAINTKFGLGSLTGLHAAVRNGKVVMVDKLVGLMTPEDLEIKDAAGRTAFHDAAIGGIVEIARFMLLKNPRLIGIQGEDDFLPVTYAFFYNRREMSAYLLSETTTEVLSQKDGIFAADFLYFSVRSLMLDLVLKALEDHPSLVAAKYNNGVNALLWTLCKTPGIFPSTGLKSLRYWQRWFYSSIYLPPVTSNGVQCQIQPKSKLQGIVRNFLELLGVNQIYDLKMIHAYSSRLLDRACDYISTLSDYSERDKIGLDIDTFNAAEFGIVEPIVEITKVHPYVLHRVQRDTQRDVLMISIVNRHEKVFSLWYGLTGGFYRGFKINRLDTQRNTILHLAGMLSPDSVLTHIPGAALQMQRELQWYKEVEDIVNPANKLRLNKDGKTPDRIFSESHKDLVKQGEKWMKATATSYTVVGALIITIMFTAAFTVPGGNSQDIGIPVFLHKKAFTTFMVSDAISLLASTASVLMFLGILTSRYAEQDFLISLPRKLIIGLSMLFISIAAMMVAFCAALILTLKGRLEIIIPIVALACILVTLFMFLQFPILVEIVNSTYGPGIFDRKMKPWI